MLAKIMFTTHVQHDNWEHGCGMERWQGYCEVFDIEFNDTPDFRNKLAGWVSERFDVCPVDFVAYVNNEADNKQFEFCQNEDSEGSRIVLTEEEPNGYLVDYEFYVLYVAEKIDYTFEEVPE